MHKESLHQSGTGRAYTHFNLQQQKMEEESRASVCLGRTSIPIFNRPDRGYFPHATTAYHMGPLQEYQSPMSPLQEYQRSPLLGERPPLLLPLQSPTTVLSTLPGLTRSPLKRSHTDVQQCDVPPKRHVIEEEEGEEEEEEEGEELDVTPTPRPQVKRRKRKKVSCWSKKRPQRGAKPATLKSPTGSGRPPTVTGITQQSPTVTGITQQSPTVTGITQQSPTVTGITQQSPTVTGITQQSPTVTGIDQQSPTGPGRHQQSPTAVSVTPSGHSDVTIDHCATHPEDSTAAAVGEAETNTDQEATVQAQEPPVQEVQELPYQEPPYQEPPVHVQELPYQEPPYQEPHIEPLSETLDINRVTDVSVNVFIGDSCTGTDTFVNVDTVRIDVNGTTTVTEGNGIVGNGITDNGTVVNGNTGSNTVVNGTTDNSTVGNGQKQQGSIESNGSRDGNGNCEIYEIAQNVCHTFSHCDTRDDTPIKPVTPVDYCEIERGGSTVDVTVTGEATFQEDLSLSAPPTLQYKNGSSCTDFIQSPESLSPVPAEEEPFATLFESLVEERAAKLRQRLKIIYTTSNNFSTPDFTQRAHTLIQECKNQF
ncbi:protein ORF156 [Cyprinid herpesvirus 2]|uniref:Protein ORF156 n=1 Tax=Cyprinid herpesvirus 2 TaxID=317878 RepID=K7PC21_CYHV2|nr:protein ORF156 [Cyprinid herpesvirus 2]AFJ20583.1 protein ORF156 [Cyprinid herpesvirus 2]